MEPRMYAIEMISYSSPLDMMWPPMYRAHHQQHEYEFLADIPSYYDRIKKCQNVDDAIYVDISQMTAPLYLH